MSKEPLRTTENQLPEKHPAPRTPKSGPILPPILQMQQLMGNQAMLQMIRARDLQPETVAGPPVIRRKIAVAEKVSLDMYLDIQGVTGYQRNGNSYSHGGMTNNILKHQILYDMLSSQRTFSVEGDNDPTAERNLEAHLDARKGIVDYTGKKQYGFAAGPAMKMNPRYWIQIGKKKLWGTQPFVTQQEAFNDLFVNPQEYKVACNAATHATLVAGSGGAELKTDYGADKTDWIPGDKGYIENVKFMDKPVDGQEGENLIYTGYRQYWGHISDENTYKSLDEWFNLVKSWNGEAKISDTRVRPKTGLID